MCTGKHPLPLKTIKCSYGISFCDNPGCFLFWNSSSKDHTGMFYDNGWLQNVVSYFQCELWSCCKGDIPSGDCQEASLSSDSQILQSHIHLKLSLLEILDVLDYSLGFVEVLWP